MARRRRGQHGWAFVPALFVVASVAHAGGIWFADLWHIWRLAVPEDDTVVIDLSGHDIEEIAFVELPPEPPKLEKDEDPVVERDKEKEGEEKEAELKKLEQKRKPELAKIDPPKPKPEKKPPPPPPPQKLAQIREVKPVPPPPIPKPPPPPPPPPQVVRQKPKPPPKFERKKMVEVQDDKSIVDEPPPDVNYYSDKNRRPDKEEYAKDRNLEKTVKGKEPASAKSNDQERPEAGGPDDKVAQTEESQATQLEKKQVASVHRGKSDHAEGIKTGERGDRGTEGQRGEGGQGGDGGSGGKTGEAGMLSMRDAQGLGVSQGGMTTAPAGQNDDAPIVSMTTNPGGRAGEPGRSGTPGRAGKPGRKGPKLNIDARDYTRIVGADKAEEEVALARKKRSAKKGKWDKKLAKIQSTLETFTGEVKPGNQTALGTRAHPFAVYIARMHNRIHEVWGFGFLADLDRKSASNPMNERTLAVTMEIVVAPSGEVEKVTIVRPSGVLTFDIAAMDTVESLGPYEETPADIRSGDGKVYIHWTFHRDDRMCTPYFADPFILENGGPGSEANVAEHGGHDHAGERKPPSQLSRPEAGVERGKQGEVQVARVRPGDVPKNDEANREAQAQRASPDDPRAGEVALAWANAFEKGDLAGLMAVSTVPFGSRGQVVAQNDGALAAVWRVVLNETEKKKVSEWQLLTPAGYRAAFGHLPEGAEDGTHALFLVARVGKDLLTLEVTQMTDGSYRVSGLTR